jgi:hypothetical protein
LKKKARRHEGTEGVAAGASPAVGDQQAVGGKRRSDEVTEWKRRVGVGGLLQKGEAR